MLVGDGLAAGTDQLRLSPAAGLEPDRHILASQLPGDLERRAPLVLGVEEVNGGGLLRVDAVQLEVAVAGVELKADVAPPERVEGLDVQPREHHRVHDGLTLRADHAAFDRPARTEPRHDLVRGVTRLDVVGDDLVRIVAFSAGLTLVEHQLADHFEKVIGRRAVDE